MKIALIGANGQLATDLLECFTRDRDGVPYATPASAGPAFTSPDRPGQPTGQVAANWQVVSLRHADLDVTNPDQVTAVLDAHAPDVVINTAAWNLVDRAEDEPVAACQANAFGPRTLARYCAERDLTLMHFSTDYVFGLKGSDTEPYGEDDAPGPVSVYGSSKLQGEYFVRALCPKHFVIRTCGLYGIAGMLGAGKGNFVETMLRLASQRDELSIVNDQYCTPSYTRDVAAASIKLLGTGRYGLYHVTNSGRMTWFEFASEIFRQAELSIRVRPVTSAEYVTRARRPAFSVLDTSNLAAVIGHALPPWQDALTRYLAQRREHPTP